MFIVGLSRWKNVSPDGMAVDTGAKIFYKQYDIDYVVESIGESAKASDRLKLNLYFDPVRRGLEMMELEIALTLQETALQELLASRCVLDDDAVIKRSYCYYKVIYDSNTRVITSFELDKKKVEKARSFSGFFSIMTHGLDFSAIDAYRNYGLRDEQEKYFQQMKDQMLADRQRNWSEEEKTGRLFILFVSLILTSFVRHVWKTTELYDLFYSSLDVVDDMRPIRLIEHTNRAKVITPFVGTQVDICDAFGFKIPEGCAPDYTSRQKHKRKRGRSPKKTVERGL
jgi:hypothetical protein